MNPDHGTFVHFSFGAEDAIELERLATAAWKDPEGAASEILGMRQIMERNGLVFDATRFHCPICADRLEEARELLADQERDHD